MLQEVHCSENTTDLWASEWGYKTLFSCCASNKAGVSTLFNSTFNLQILKLFADPNGRLIICDIEANTKLLILANIYAPTRMIQTFSTLSLINYPAFIVKKL